MEGNQASMDISDALVFVIVVLGRLIIPLFIFRYPLPAIIAALLLDAADETIFQLLTNLNLENYQSYDKALDVYYLALTYIATMRNWSNIFAFKVGRFLWYYRLVGVTLFELLGFRFLLLVFANTFEYFFIWYEGVRTRWDPRRMTATVVVGAAAAIWIFIKLPQEYWIHVAQNDTTDFFKESILGVPLDTGWGPAFAENLWIFPVMLVLAAGIAALVRWGYRKLPTADWSLSFDSNDNADEYLHARTRPAEERHWREGLLEKIALVGLVTIIFGKMLPNVDASALQLATGVTVLVVANSFISHWLALRGTRWRSVATEFSALTAINLVVAIVYVVILPSFEGSVRWQDLLFFVLLLTLIVTLFDRYRPTYDLRLAAEQPEQGSSPVSGMPVDNRSPDEEQASAIRIQ
jgi:hypothetical protein